MKELSPRNSPRRSRAGTARHVLRLYVNGSTLKSMLAVANVKRVCERYLEGRYQLEVIDIHKHAHLARDEQIVAVPTLIRQRPAPLRRLVGDMSDLKNVLLGPALVVRTP